jgi:hypothetical protein
VRKGWFGRAWNAKALFGNFWVFLDETSEGEEQKKP